MNEANELKTIESSVLSTDGHSWLRTMLWVPAPGVTRRAAVQLIHGMAEHIERYDDFARFLASLGYVVFGHDHVGHGKSVAAENELGHLPLDGGKDILIGDAWGVHQAILEQNPSVAELPQFLFGHSMGSFIARAVIARHGSNFAGAVICGTGNPSHATSVGGNALARVIGTLRGAEYRSKLLDNMVIGAYAKTIEDAETECDWISTDPVVVNAYIDDPLSGQMFSVGGYATLTDLTAEVVTSQHAEQVPGRLPLLFVAGAEDPVGACGADVRRAADLYKDAGVRDVRTIIYPGMRHEILNEPRHDEVYNDVETWLTEHAALVTAVTADVTTETEVAAPEAVADEAAEIATAETAEAEAAAEPEASTEPTTNAD